MKLRFYAILALLIGATAVNAQDIHFSQFYAAPLTLNPALTGNFNGLYRITGIYRNQWPGLTTNKPAFSTPSVGVDFSLLRDKLKHGALGVGLVFANDQQNGKTFNNNLIMASVAYNMGFGASNKFQLGVGLQGGLLMTKADLTKLHFDEGFTDAQGNYNSSYTGESLQTGSKTKGMFNIGVFAKYDFYKGMRVYVGYSFNNAAQYKQNYVNNSVQTYKIPFRNTLHGGFEFEIKDKAILIPGILFQHSTADNAETELGLTAGIHVIKSPDPSKRATIFFGLWDRLNNANSTIIPKVGFEYKQFRAGFAYDAALTKQRADASNIGGGMAQAFEVTLSFIGDIKIPKEDHWLFNPRY